MAKKNYYFDNRSELVGVVRDLAAKKLGAGKDDRIEFGEYTWDSGYCETCSYTEYEFTVILNDKVVYDSQEEGQYVVSAFAAFQEWLTK